MTGVGYTAIAGLLATLILASGCAFGPQYDYSAYRENPPRSILVLPPVNETVAVDAPYVYLSTITRPLVEAGYYVYPVAVVDAFMKENGLPSPAEMQSVPLHKIDEVIGPDAVLYTKIETWGQQYRIVSSETVVRAKLRLVDTDTGVTLWDGTASAVQGSNGAQGGLLASVIAAAVNQIAGTVADRSHEVARRANSDLVDNRATGLPLGPYNPDYTTDPRRQ